MSGRQPSNGQIVGIAVLLFSSVLIGESLHHLISTGTCSSTGYTQFGPAPQCPKGTVWWVLFIPFGVIASIVGGAIGSGGALIIPALFSAIGLGSLSVALESGASSSEKLFAVIFGGCFALVGISVGMVALSSMMKPASRGRRASTGRIRALKVVGQANVAAPGPPTVIEPGQASSSTTEAEAQIFGTEKD
jgi:hypothetical protein